MFEPCPCGSGKGYLACCGPLHAGARAPTAEALMRARYSAYALGDAAFVLNTCAPETRPSRLDLDPARTWTGPAVECARDTAPSRAEVRFTVRLRNRGRKVRLTETSRFRLDGRRWLYVDGDLD